jgi:N-acetylneuraminate synthase
VNKFFRIGEFEVGCPMNPYIIAEIGVNHEGSIELAKQLIDEAVEGGAHAAKFQSYKAGKIASKFSPAYWDLNEEPTDSQYKLFQKYDNFEPRHYRELADYCFKKGIDFMSTPFDLDAVDFLEPLVPAFKIASADITNFPLLRKVAGTGKPIIISTGASSLPEIQMAVDELSRFGAQKIALLHCILNYPTPIERAQLGMIQTLQRVFPCCVIGYSDHVVPDDTISAFECAMMLGSCILEKHFTHDKSLPGNDHYHAMDTEDLKRFKIKLENYKVMLGGGQKNLEFEAAARQHARRSIVAARNIKAGEVLTEENLIVKRPAHGVSPIHWDEVLGTIANLDIEDDTPLLWSMFSTKSELAL